MQLKLFIIILLGLISHISEGQKIDFSKPISKWPDPYSFSNAERIELGYTKERILKYLKREDEWRKSNLPKIYLLKKYENELNEYMNSNFHIDQNKKTIPWDSVLNITITKWDYFSTQLDKDNPCQSIKKLSSNIYLIEVDSTKQNAIVEIVQCKIKDPLIEDDITPYNQIIKGDSVIIEFRDKNNEN